MLLNLLNADSYLMVNIDAIKTFGLNNAVYCAELLVIADKAYRKKKLFDKKFFKVDRNYVANKTSLSVEDQLKCDANLKKINVIDINENNPDIIYFDVDVFASILASQDVKLLDKVSAKVKVTNPKGVKQAQRDRVILSLKEAIECKTPEILFALQGWIDSIMADPSRYLSKLQVKAFKDRLDEFCNGDLQKALDVINLAVVHGYVDCQWAINLYTRGNQPNYATKSSTINTRTTEQIRTTALGEEMF